MFVRSRQRPSVTPPDSEPQLCFINGTMGSQPATEDRGGHSYAGIHHSRGVFPLGFLSVVCKTVRLARA